MKTFQMIPDINGCCTMPNGEFVFTDYRNAIIMIHNTVGSYKCEMLFRSFYDELFHILISNAVTCLIDVARIGNNVIRITSGEDRIINNVDIKKNENTKVNSNK